VQSGRGQTTWWPRSCLRNAISNRDRAGYAHGLLAVCEELCEALGWPFPEVVLPDLCDELTLRFQVGTTVPLKLKLPPTHPPTPRVP
jgi:hypothetical protein